MKIKINENENYCIDLPEEINSHEFLGMIERLNYIAKIISRDTSFVLAPAIIKTQASRKTYKIPLNTNRELTLALTKLYYTRQDEELKKQLLSNGMLWEIDRAQRELARFIKKHNITEQEAGIKFRRIKYNNATANN